MIDANHDTTTRADKSISTVSTNDHCQLTVDKEEENRRYKAEKHLDITTPTTSNQLKPSTSTGNKTLISISEERNEKLEIIEEDNGDGDDDNGNSNRSNHYCNSFPDTTSSSDKVSNNQEHVELGKVKLVLLMICLSIGTALPSIDVSIVIAIMTDIGSEFQRANLSTWIYSAYTLCALIIIPAVGGLSNAFNRKPILVINTFVFLVGSILCAFSQSFTQVVAARAISGLGGGPISLMSNIIIHDVVPKEKRASYQSYISTVQTLAFSIGSPLGGLISDTIGWRYCFRINIPPLILILYFYLFHLKNYKAPKQRQLLQEKKKVNLTIREKLKMIDFGGIFLISLASFLFTSAFLLGGNILAWNHPFILTAIIIAPGIYGLFIVHQNRWSKHPLLPRTVSTNRNFVNACLCVGFSAATEASAVTIIPLFLMVGLHFTTAKSGAWLMIEAISVPVGCFIAGRYIRYTGRFSWLLLFSRVLCASSYVILYFWIGNDIPIAGGTVGIVLQGMTFGFTVVILVIVASNTVPQDLVPSALSIYMLSRSISFLMGVSITSAIIQSVLKILLTEKVHGSDADQMVEYIRTSIRHIDTLSPELQQIAASVLSSAVQKATLYTIGTAILAIIAAFFMKNVSLIKKPSSSSAKDNHS